MTELFLTLIIISAFICVVCVIINIGSKRKAFSLVSVCCGVMIIALAFCCAVEIKSDNKPQSTTQTAIIIDKGKTEKQTSESIEKAGTEVHKTAESRTAEAAEADSPDRIVYITKTGKKYHYSYDCSAVDFYECTLAEALEMGFEPCGKCVD